MFTIIIQARLGGERFPGKVIENICGVPMIARIVYRLSSIMKDSAYQNSKIVVACPRYSDKIEEVLKRNLMIKMMTKQVFYESPDVREDDVLGRFASVARAYDSKAVVRVTGDCPLIDPDLIKEAMGIYKEGKYNFITLGPSYPEGLDFEIFDSKLLIDADKNATSTADREHVTPYIWKGKTQIRVNQYYMECNDHLGEHSWSVDTDSDMALIRMIYANLSEFDKNYKILWDVVDRRSGFRQIVSMLNDPANKHLYDQSTSKSINKKYLEQEGTSDSWADYRYGRKQS